MTTSKNSGPSWDIHHAPINSRELRPLGAAIRLITGVGMVGYSIITSTIIVGWLLDPLIGGDMGGIHYAYLIGFIFGLGVTIAEWATSDEKPKVHWFLVLVLDAPFSASQTFLWLMVIVNARAASAANEWTIVVALVSIVWGIVTAKLGEKLLIRK